MLHTKTRGKVLDVINSRGPVSPSTTTLYDRSRYGNNGAITGATWTRLNSGLWIQAFNGTSAYVSCGNNKSLNIPGKLTIEMWAKINIFTGNGKLVATDVGSEIENQYLLQVGSTPDRIFFSRGNSVTTNQIVTGTLLTGLWYHLVFVDIGTNLLAYTNAGTPESAGLFITPKSTIIGLVLGKYGTFVGHYFSGLMALVRIYNYALSAGQIYQRFENTRSLFGV